VGSVKASVKSTSTKMYTLIDVLKESMLVQYYYRIKQIDDNGKYEYSKVILLEPGTRANGLSVTNPFIDYPTLVIQNEEKAQQVMFEMFDIQGKELYSQTVQLTDGANHLP
jgi:hypothetical protein